MRSSELSANSYQLNVRETFNLSRWQLNADG